MRYRLVMQIHQAFQQLIHDVLCFAFAKTIARLNVTGDVGEQISAGAEL